MKQAASRRRWVLLAAAFAIVAVACDRSPSADTSEQPAENPANATSIDEQEVNLDVWLERMEVGSRELYSARAAVVEAVGLKAGDKIADVGAGTGLYSLLFAEEVGADGAVYAVDIEPLFLDLINQRAEDDGFQNITSVLNRINSITLPRESVDVVFIADTYHYFDDREAIMTTVFDALKPGGKLIIVDYDIQPGEARPEDKSHIKFGKAAVISEIEFVGFAHEQNAVIDGLEENYFAVFRKPAQ